MYVQSGLKIGKIPLNYENLSMQLLNLLEDLLQANIQSRAEKQNKIIDAFCFCIRIKADSWEECVNQCCQFSRCNVAYYLSSTCLHIECLSDDLCEPIDAFNSNINDETLFLKVRSVGKLRRMFVDLNIMLFICFFFFSIS